METRYVVETGLDVHVVSHVERVGNKLKLTSIFPSKVSSIEIPLDSVISVIKEEVSSEDLTSKFVEKEIVLT